MVPQHLQPAGRARNIRLAGRASDVDASLSDALIVHVVNSALKRLPLVRFVTAILTVQLSIWLVRGPAEV